MTRKWGRLDWFWLEELLSTPRWPCKRDKFTVATSMIRMMSCFRYWRILSEVHSISQTLVGAFVGTLFAAIVFYYEKTVETIVREHFDISTFSEISVPLFIRAIMVAIGMVVVYLIKTHTIDL
jgi:uncharacterized membrane protein